ncbi:hypothetical protein GCM10008955_33200 [Deinococcus malanensis]|uniref:Uncharacterized protein n=1 Tax=Deinococcus malanensis TaxID=1706855 RepID=A0ABQ2F2U7_9DEIO|nr:hypothetical protein [Deinococcus malanensis]GGK36740.1 hypothetical protein GCM10008955_33200 [Deinococcus malanensis]
MKKTTERYIAKSVSGVGWRIWSTPTEQWWGNAFQAYPTALLEELNGPKRTDRLLELSRQGNIRS